MDAQPGRTRRPDKTSNKASDRTQKTAQQERSGTGVPGCTGGTASAKTGDQDARIGKTQDGRRTGRQGRECTDDGRETQRTRQAHPRQVPDEAGTPPTRLAHPERGKRSSGEGGTPPANSMNPPEPGVQFCTVP
ncbi:hypothetical protein BV22DRAFT_1045646 [Leucogyrophana mollusca]|uniref:Uncharacterized protein n=1 Tax=Leucogyrophana mollusca TaxID=85980 RepID=A0ACB8BPH8_9AGAM|nr:hypothetical protein BV22DRAFT_1045646 [Leucogyrophana mollusca]